MRQTTELKKLKIARRDALDFLRSHCTAVVATVFEDQPHASAVYFIVDDYFNVYFSTKRNTNKNIHTAFNDRVAVVVGTGPEHISAQLKGRAFLLTGEEKIQTLKKLEKLRTDMGIVRPPIQAMAILRKRHTNVFKVVPYECQFMNLDSTKYPASISSHYYQIIPNVLDYDKQ